MRAATLILIAQSSSSVKPLGKFTSSVFFLHIKLFAGKCTRCTINICKYKNINVCVCWESFIPEICSFLLHQWNALYSFFPIIAFLYDANRNLLWSLFWPSSSSMLWQSFCFIPSYFYLPTGSFALLLQSSGSWIVDTMHSHSRCVQQSNDNNNIRLQNDCYFCRRRVDDDACFPMNKLHIIDGERGRVSNGKQVLMGKMINSFVVLSLSTIHRAAAATTTRQEFRGLVAIHAFMSQVALLLLQCRAG